MCYMAVLYLFIGIRGIDIIYVENCMVVLPLRELVLLSL